MKESYLKFGRTSTTNLDSKPENTNNLKNKEEIFPLIVEEYFGYCDFLLELARKIGGEYKNDAKLQLDIAFIQLRKTGEVSKNLKSLREKFQYLQQIEFKWFSEYERAKEIKERIETKAIDKYHPQDLNPELIAERMRKIERDKVLYEDEEES